MAEQEPAGYPSIDAHVEVRAREYFDLIADNAFKDAVIQTLQGKLDTMAAQIEALTNGRRRIGFDPNDLEQNRQYTG